MLADIRKLFFRDIYTTLFWVSVLLAFFTEGISQTFGIVGIYLFGMLMNVAEIVRESEERILSKLGNNDE